MKNKLSRPVFLSNGKRWPRIKLFSRLLVLAILVIVGLLSYSYFASPFSNHHQSLSNWEIDMAVEKINEQVRPVVNQGTFMGIQRLYGEEYVVRSGEERKAVILTFDDGPDPEYSPKILEILKKENVKGTFFVTGTQIYKHPEIGHQILAQGSDMGLHTFSHSENKKDEKLYFWTFIKELDFTEKIFAYHYGFETKLFRVPYLGIEDTLSSNSLQYIGEAQKRGLTVSAPTVDSRDWDVENDAKKIVRLATTADVQTVDILFHDAGGDRNNTLEALPEVIKFYKDRGYEFLTTSELAQMNALPYSEPLSWYDRFISASTYSTYNFITQSPRFLDRGFIAGFVFVLLHTSLFVILAIIGYWKEKRSLKNLARQNKSLKPLVSVIIPMHNEERSIAQSIKAVLSSTYSHLELLVVDDGSNDSSFEIARQTASDPRLKILSKVQGGKFSALNHGLLKAKGKITVFVDADTIVRSDAIEELVGSFYTRRVGAVAGNIIIGNKTNWLSKLQALEYDLSQSLEKRVFDLSDNVMIVPGAFGAWRTKLIRQEGGFTNETHSEDFDLTLALIRRGFKVKFNSRSLAYTEAPLTLKAFFTQRFRWNFGNLQVLYKYRSLLFNTRYNWLGLVLLPRAVFIQLPGLLLTFFVDLFIISNLLIGERRLTLWFLLFYFILSFIVAKVAYKLEGRKFRNIFLVICYRFPYTQFLYVSLFSAVLKALKGELVAWTKMNHSGKLSIASEPQLVEKVVVKETS